MHIYKSLWEILKYELNRFHILLNVIILMTFPVKLHHEITQNKEPFVIK